MTAFLFDVNVLIALLDGGDTSVVPVRSQIWSGESSGENLKLGACAQGRLRVDSGRSAFRNGRGKADAVVALVFRYRLALAISAIASYIHW
jgi:hypothetical protein